MNCKNLYYVYAYLREDGSPYYIGKGKNKRAFNKKGHRISIPNIDRIVFWQNNLLDEDAIKLEIKYIKLFGRKDLGTGILRNMTDGGDGRSGKGKPLSEEHKKNLCKPRGPQKKPRKSCGPLSEEHKQKMRGPRGSRGPQKNPSGPRGPQKNPCGLRGPLSEEHKKKISNSLKKIGV